MFLLHFYPFDLEFKDVFAVSANSRTSTEAIFIELSLDGKTGYGQASFPPYLKEKRDSNLKFLSEINLNSFSTVDDLPEIFKYLNALSSEYEPAKAAMDMALYDLTGKIKNVSVHQLFDLSLPSELNTSCTIGIGKPDFILAKIQKAKDFKFLKIKLANDFKTNSETIHLIQQNTSQEIGVDFNQAYSNKEDALRMLIWLSENKIAYAEQPLLPIMKEEQRWLKENSPIEIYGDESFQNLKDLKNNHSLFDGVNIKLMKCGGLREAYEMALTAKAMGMKRMLGCMAESSCAVTAAAHLSILFDKIDLDGNLIIANDPFLGLEVHSGKLHIPQGPGLGIQKK